MRGVIWFLERDVYLTNKVHVSSNIIAMLVEAEIRINQGPQASQAAKVSQGRGPCRHLASWTSTMDTT